MASLLRLVEIETKRVGAGFGIARRPLRWLLDILGRGIVGLLNLVLRHGLIHDHLLDSLDHTLVPFHDLKIDLLVCRLGLSEKAGLRNNRPISSEQNTAFLASVSDPDELLFHKDSFVDRLALLKALLDVPQKAFWIVIIHCNFSKLIWR